MQEFLLQFFKAIAIQTFGLFGVFFILGFILSKLQEWTQKNYLKSVGWKGILWTAWFGTPFHEYGHVIFAKIFRHRIDEIALFRPNAETGELGYVNHSHNPRNLYQSLGNFFIGAAPMLFGSFFLYLLLRFLPNGKTVLEPLFSNDDSVLSLLKNIPESIFNLFSLENLRSTYFWLFLYASFCIASHIAPSKADRKEMWRGLILIIVLLAIINVLFLLIKIDLTPYILNFSQLFGVLTTLFVYAGIISFFHLIFSFLIVFIFKRRG